MANIECSVIESYGKLSESEDAKELRLISWNGRVPKYDLRGWYKDENGEERMTKGVTISQDELKALYEILKSMDEEGIFNDGNK